MTKFKQCPICELEWQNDLEEGPHFDQSGEPIIDESFKCNSCDSNIIDSKIELEEFQRCMSNLHR